MKGQVESVVSTMEKTLKILISTSRLLYEPGPRSSEEVRFTEPAEFGFMDRNNAYTHVISQR